MNEHLKQTGRTTRLVERACQEASKGRAVYILAHSGDYAKLLREDIDRTWEAMRLARSHGIKVENMQHWEEHQLWDWNTMQPMRKGAHPNCLFLVDHAAVEIRLTQIHADIKYLATLAGKLYPHTV